MSSHYHRHRPHDAGPHHLPPPAEPERLALKEKPLESLKPTLPRTQENFRKVIREIQKAVN